MRSGELLTYCGLIPGFKPHLVVRRAPAPPNSGRSPKIVTTFGVDLEFVLAFHEGGLLDILEQHDPPTEIKKYLNETEHVSLIGNFPRSVHYQRSHFPSWGMYDPPNDRKYDPVLIFASRPMLNPDPSYGRIRRYFMEPLLIAQKILGIDCPAAVIGTSVQTEIQYLMGPRTLR